MLPPVPACAKALDASLEALLPPDKAQRVAEAREAVEKAAANRRLRLERISAFEDAARSLEETRSRLAERRRDVRDATAQLRSAEHRRLDVEGFDERPKKETEAEARDRARRAAAARELSAAADAARSAMEVASKSVEVLERELAEGKADVARCSKSLQNIGVDVADRKTDSEEEDEPPKALASSPFGGGLPQKRRGSMLKSKLRKAATMGALLQSSTAGMTASGQELAKRRSAPPEKLFAAFGDGAWEPAANAFARCVGVRDLRSLGSAHRSCANFSRPRLREDAAAVVMQKSTRALGHARHYAHIRKERRATNRIQKASRAVRHFRAVNDVGAARCVLDNTARRLRGARASRARRWSRLNFHVAAGASRLISTSRPRRRRDSSPRNSHVAAATRLHGIAARQSGRRPPSGERSRSTQPKGAVPAQARPRSSTRLCYSNWVPSSRR